ncbi:MAG: hypothetical protein ACT4PV_10695 [Planctomycetaceae bacterium]
MTRRRLTFGRVFALLILGVAAGAGLFLAHRLDPTEIDREVRAALARILNGPFELKAVVPRLGKGVELQGLRLLYPDGTPAATIERALLYVDHQRLLQGHLEIPHVELAGVTIRLKTPDQAGGVRGVFTEEADRPSGPRARFPHVTVLPGTGNRVQFVRRGVLRETDTVDLGVAFLEARYDGGLYRVEAELGSEVLGPVLVTASYDPEAARIAGRAQAARVRWDEDAAERLGPFWGSPLPPIRLGGSADVVVEAHVELRPFRLSYLYGRADLSGLAGRFGNLQSGRPEGYPFGFRDGRGMVVLDGGRLKLIGLKGSYVSPSGRTGQVGASFDAILDRAGTDLDLHLFGANLHATTADLRLLLASKTVESIVDKYEPAGTFDLDLSISRRLGLPENVHAVLELDGGHFNYAGPLDDATGRRYGFRYPLEECRGRIELRSGVRTPRGLARVVDLVRIDASRPVRAPRPGAPDRVRVAGRGRVVAYLQAPGEPEDADVRIRVLALPVDADLNEAFASAREGIPYRGFTLDGSAEYVNVHVKQDAFGLVVALADYEVFLRDCTLAYHAFPLHVDGLTGLVVSRALPPKSAGGKSRREMELVRLEGTARDGGRVVAAGWVLEDEAGKDDLNVHVHLKGLVLGPDLEAAVGRSSVAGWSVESLWRRVRPSGRIDADVFVRSAESADIDLELGGTVSLAGYGAIDYPIRNLEGALSYRQGIVRVRELRGLLPQGSLAVDGLIQGDGVLDLAVSLQRLGLQPELQEILGETMPELGRELRRLSVSMPSMLDLKLRALRKRPEERIEIDAEASDLDLNAVVGGTPMRVRGGPIGFAPGTFRSGELWIEADGGYVRVREARLALERGGGGRVLLDAKGIHPVAHLGALLGSGIGKVLGSNVRIDLEAFELNFNRADGRVVLAGAVDLRRQAMLQEQQGTLEPTGALELAPITLTPGETPTFSGLIRYRGLNMKLPAGLADLHGQLLVGEGRLGEGLAIRGAILDGTLLAFGRQIEGLALNLEIDPYHVRLGEVVGRFYDGSLRGEVQIHLADPGAFRIRLQAADVDLGKFLRGDRPAEDPMAGRVDAVIEVESPSGDAVDMAGRGEIRVREGELFEIPFFRTILSVLGAVTPIRARPRFRDAVIEYEIRGETIDVKRMHLSTPVSDIYGSGTASIYGDLDLVINPQVTRLIDLPRLLDIPILSTIRNLWHRMVYEVRVVGTVQSPNLRLRALPFLKDRGRSFPSSPHAAQAERIRPDLLP